MRQQAFSVKPAGGRADPAQTDLARLRLICRQKPIKKPAKLAGSSDYLYYLIEVILIRVYS